MTKSMLATAKKTKAAPVTTGKVTGKKTIALKSGDKQRKARKVVPEPLGTFNRRYDQLVKDNPLPYRVRPYNPIALRDAAQAHAKNNPSDPFAGARIATHMRRGLANVEDVARDERHTFRVMEYARQHRLAKADVIPELEQEAA